MAMVVVDAIAA